MKRYLLLLSILTMVVFSGCGGQTGNLQAHYEKAHKLFFEEQDMDAAYSELEYIQKTKPAFIAPHLNYMLSYIYEQRHRYDDAIKGYLKELHVNPQKSKQDTDVYQWSLSGLADSYYKSGLLHRDLFELALNSEVNYYSCKLYLAKDTQGTKSRDYLYYYRGLCYYYLSEFGKAVDDLKRVENYSPAMVILGACYYRQGMSPEAVKIWDRVKTTKDQRVLALLGRIFVECGFVPDDGLKLCEKAYHDGPGEVTGICLASVLVDTGCVDKALNLMDKIKPDSPEIIDEWGGYTDTETGIKIAYTTKFYDPQYLMIQAKAYFLKAVEYYLRIKDEQSLCQAGICQLEAGDRKKAFSSLSKASESKEEGVRTKALINIGVLACLNGNYEEAFKIWENILNASSNPLMKSDVGLAYVEAGIKLDKAISLCKLAGAEEPGALSQNLGLAYLKKGMLDDDAGLLGYAISYLEKNHIQESGYSLERNDPIVLLSLAKAHYYRRVFKLPAEIMLAFRDIYPESNQVFNAFQSVEEAWQIIKWEKETKWGHEWYLFR
ncbi:MAG: hypothetical protein ABH886_10735 [Candidatus Desantisbacteria bacterium]